MRNEKRGSFQKTTIYYSMLFNLYAYWNEHKFITVCYSTCVYWNETRGTVFKKKTPIYYSMLFNLCAYWNETRGVVFKKIQLMTICYWTHVRNETRGAVFKKQQFITVCYSTCVRIEMKQEGQFSKKTPIYYSMLFNLYAYWNETRGQFSKKSMTICY